MSEEGRNEAEADDSAAIDPPNDSPEDNSNLSSGEFEPVVIDPPNDN